MSNNSRDEQKQILENELQSSREHLKHLIGDAQSNKNEAEERNDTDSAAYFDDLIFQYSRALQLTFEEQLKKLDDSDKMQKIIDSFEKTNKKLNKTLKLLEKIERYAEWTRQASNVLDDLIQAAAAFAK